MSEYVTDDACKQRTGEILLTVQRIEDRLYKDNGHLSIQTRLDRHEQCLTTMRRVVWAVFLALCTPLTMLVVRTLMSHAK